MTKVVVVDPVYDGQTDDLAAPRAPKRSLPARPRLALLGNGRPGAQETLDEIGRMFRARVPAIGDVLTFSKADGGRPMPDDALAEVARSCDIVLTGVGECGSCTVFTALDTAAFDRLGLPAGMVVNKAFARLAKQTAERADFLDCPLIVIPYRASSLTAGDIELRDTVISAAEVMLSAALPVRKS